MSKTSFSVAAAAALTLAALAAAPAAQAGGLKVAKDPVTGELRAANAEEARALDANLGKTAAKRGLLTGKLNPQPIQYADGTVEQELTEESMSFSVAVRNADGSVSLDCVTGPEAAAQAMKGGKTAAAAKASKERHLAVK